MPRHFSKMMKSPYFQTNHYHNESKEAQIEMKIEKKIASFLSLFNFKKRGSK
jgi:hypothetical protein